MSAASLEESIAPLYTIVIDASSTKTKVFIFEFQDRILYSNQDIEDAIIGKKLSYPSVDGLNDSIQVDIGITEYAYMDNVVDMGEALEALLTPLMDFAKTTLADREADWSAFPIYLGATAAARMLPRPYRIRLMNVILNLLEDESFNPFGFEPDFSRVLSGQEQAAFEWATYNQMYGVLAEGNDGSGQMVTKWGIFTMSDDSFELVYMDEDINVEGDFFKYRLGMAYFYNLYAKSYLFSGLKSSYDRLNAMLIQQAGNVTADVFNPCMPGLSTFNFTSRVEYGEDGNWVPFSRADNPWELDVTEKTYILKNTKEFGIYSECRNFAHELLLLGTNVHWCNFAHNWDCAMAGEYAPPTTEIGDMFGTGYIFDVVQFLGFGDGATLKDIQVNTIEICNMDIDTLLKYNADLDYSYPEEVVPLFCWASCWMQAMIIDAYGFPDTYYLRVRQLAGATPESPGSPSEWALGGAMYEVNTLPWKLQKQFAKDDYTKNGQNGQNGVSRKLLTAPTSEDSSTIAPSFGFFMMLLALVALVVAVQKSVAGRK